VTGPEAGPDSSPDLPDPSPTPTASRRAFLNVTALTLASVALCSDGFDWRTLLGDYVTAARRNIVTVNGRRAMLSSRLYPGTYVRDALFWGPLALDDPALGFECYQWFAETQLDKGQIRTAVPLHPEEAGALQPQDDEGTLLFIIASDWLHRAGYPVDPAVIERAYSWIESHIQDDVYVSPPGPFRYWADTVQLDVAESLAHNQGLLCLARQAMRSLALGNVTGADVAAAQAAYRGFEADGSLRMGRHSRFASAHDISALFPEFLSRMLYEEAILGDALIVKHVSRTLVNASVRDGSGAVAGIKVICAADGSFLPDEWFFRHDLNQPGDYQNGGYWPMYTLVALAMAYKISGDLAYADVMGRLVTRELARDHRSKEVIRLMPGLVGNYDGRRTNYTWNALIKTACRWARLID
jgi:hypothetical protein